MRLNSVISSILKVNNMNNRKLANKLDQFLEIHQFKDYCPNGLQVEGREQVKKIVTGVTANQDLIDAAIAQMRMQF